MPGLDPGIHDDFQQAKAFTYDFLVARLHGLPGHWRAKHAVLLDGYARQ
jgi:hypothetical protein